MGLNTIKEIECFVTFGSGIKALIYKHGQQLSYGSNLIEVYICKGRQFKGWQCNVIKETIKKWEYFMKSGNADKELMKFKAVNIL